MSDINRSDLIERVARKVKGLKKNDVDQAVRVILRDISTALRQRRRVELRGFGVFSLKTWHARGGRNPKTGERIYLRQQNLVHFRPGSELAQKVGGNRDEEREGPQQ